MSDDVDFLSQLVRNSMEIKAQDAADNTDDQEVTVMKPQQVHPFKHHAVHYYNFLLLFCLSQSIL